MNYILSVPVILDIIRAHAAAHALSLAPDRRSSLSPLLDNARLPLLDTLVTTAFTTTVMALGAVVTDSSVTTPEYESEACLEISLSVPAGFTASHHVVVRRALEQTVALSALDMWLRTLPDLPASIHATIASTVAETRRDLLSALRPPFPPMMRC